MVIACNPERKECRNKKNPSTEITILTKICLSGKRIYGTEIYIRCK